MTKRAKQVAVCGPNHCNYTWADLAGRVGRLLAQRGAVTLCGVDDGVMGAAAAGARSAGGVVIGIQPGEKTKDADEDLSGLIATNMGEARGAVLVGSADAVIVIGGSWDTLSEVALANHRGIPVISLMGWTVHDHLGEPINAGQIANTSEEAVDKALAA